MSVLAIQSLKRKQEDSFDCGVQSKVAKTGSGISCMPHDLVMHALKFLPPIDLACASGVCKEWNVVASQLWNDFDLSKICKVIDEAVWKKHVDLDAFGLDASGAPSIDKRTVIPLLLRLSKQVKEEEGITLLTLPKGLTLNKLMRLASVPKQGPAPRFRFILPCVQENFGNIAVRRTYTVAITNSILTNSVSISMSGKKELIARNGCELPGVLPLATLVFLTYMSSPVKAAPVRLYRGSPLTITLCSEQIDGFDVDIGSFHSSGLYVGRASPQLTFEGAAALKVLQ